MQQPVPFYLRKAENAYNFFTSMEASNTPFTLADIAQFTGYRASVVERYLRMKWRKWFIEPAGNGHYRCTRAIYDHDKTFFIRTLSQGIHFPELSPSSQVTNVVSPLSTFDTTGYFLFIAALIIIAAFYKVSYRWRYAISVWYGKQWWLIWWPLVLHERLS